MNIKKTMRCLSVPPDTAMYKFIIEFHEKINKNRRHKITKRETLDILGTLLERIVIYFPDGYVIKKTIERKEERFF